MKKHKFEKSITAKKTYFQELTENGRFTHKDHGEIVGYTEIRHPDGSKDKAYITEDGNIIEETEAKK